MRRQSGASGLTEKRLALPGALRPWFADAAFTSVDGELREPFTHVPDAATKMVVRVEENGRRDVLVVGPRTRASYHASKRLASCVQLRLGPGSGPPVARRTGGRSRRPGRTAATTSPATTLANWPTNSFRWSPSRWSPT